MGLVLLALTSFFYETWFSMALRSIGDAVIATDGGPGPVREPGRRVPHGLVPGRGAREGPRSGLPDRQREDPAGRSRTRSTRCSRDGADRRPGQPHGPDRPGRHRDGRSTTARRRSRTTRASVDGRRPGLPRRDRAEAGRRLKERLAAIVGVFRRRHLSKTLDGIITAGTGAPSGSSATRPTRSSASTSRC